MASAINFFLNLRNPGTYAELSDRELEEEIFRLEWNFTHVYQLFIEPAIVYRSETAAGNYTGRIPPSIFRREQLFLPGYERMRLLLRLAREEERQRIEKALAELSRLDFSK